MIRTAERLKARPARRVCDGPSLVAALQAASGWLDAHAERINALNVFPVPDGDTGTNMSLTVRAALQAIGDPPPLAVGEVAALAARGALLDARGNSGVILSQVFRGFAHALESCEALEAEDLARALGEAARVAYRGVSQPVEGTLLTVTREVGEAAEAALRLGQDLPRLLESCLHAAEASVARTPEQLDVLRRAGVVDAGGEGYRVLLEGAWMHLTGQKFELAAAGQPGAVLARARGQEGAPFGFCTELVLSELRAKPAEIRQAMEALGQSVLVVGDDALVRIHVHALRPGQVLDYAVEHGTVQQVKIENMQLQHAGFVAAHTAEQEGLSRIGVIAVAAGDGVRELFRSLGAAAVVEGGQTMNPSVREILGAVNGAAYEELVVLPNNGNILLTANQVKGLTPRRLEVVPTTNFCQGIAAAMAFNYQDDLETNLARMRQAAERVRTVEVTKAVRDAQGERVRVTRGELMALLDGEIVACGSEVDALLERALRLGDAQRGELVTVYYGRDVPEQEAEGLAERLSARLPGPAWEVVRGGQPHYSYVVSIE